MEGTYQVNRNSTLSAVVEGSGKGVVAHVGLHALGAFADRLALGDSLSGPHDPRYDVIEVRIGEARSTTGSTRPSGPAQVIS
jgi:hypothetical protein